VLHAFSFIIRRELRLALRRKGDVLNVLVFFVVVASLFPLGVGPEPNQLRAMAAGVVWIAALLAAVLSLPRLFAADYADGTLEQMLVSPQPLLVIVLAKAAAHWLLTGLPLTLAAPVIGLQYDLPPGALGVLLASLLIGTPVLSLLGAVGAALTLGLRSGAALVFLLVLPLTVPTLIFGTGAVAAVEGGQPARAELSLMGALLIVTALGAPLASAAALRISLE